MNGWYSICSAAIGARTSSTAWRIIFMLKLHTPIALVPPSALIVVISSSTATGHPEIQAQHSLLNWCGLFLDARPTTTTRRMEKMPREHLAKTEVDIERAAPRYRQITDITLPT